ncbi:MAG TPA: hypothetical protein VFE82_06120 [Ramlibacter sp.]|jgi:hypothetical protein|uniref:hypothetical protein n=1 Tax=Ramlibacter sp. TaxID=1917967 RepID=UPI002D475EB2|nr:hypothetical protein [Ramlibacter sp.]HZY18040.1 hypothetical protein [Ramlibacter sp.]
MPKVLPTAVAAAVLAAAAFLLNPTPEQHRAKIRSTIAQRSPLAGAMGLGALAAFTSSYHSLGIASYTTVNGRISSIGVLGWVYVPSRGTAG